MRERASIAFALWLCAGGLAASAQAQSPDWSHNLYIYGMAPFIQGEIAKGLVVGGEVDLDPSTIIDNLNMVAMVGYRGTKDRWALQADVVYMALGNSNELGRADLDEWITSVTGAYRFSKYGEVLFGAMYFSITPDIKGSGPLGFRLNTTVSWLDPVIGFQCIRPLNEKWRFQGRGDLGGFGIGSKFSWQAMINFGYQPWERASFFFGYRGLGHNYEEGSGRDFLKLDLVYHGPQVGVMFHF